MNIFCLRASFKQKIIFSDFSYIPLICMEINITQILSKVFVHEKNSFNFIFFSVDLNDLIALYTDKSDIYKDIRNIFNNPIYGNYTIKINILDYFIFYMLNYLKILLY